MGRIPRQAPPPGVLPGLDFTGHMRRLCADIAARLPDFSHVRMQQVAIRLCQTRKRVSHGIYASLTPLRFAAGKRTIERRGRTWTIEPVRDETGREMLYLLSFYLPRFCDQPFAEKLATVIHELWHIGPDFDGDLRRLPGRFFAHGRSEAQFHKHMHDRASAWLALSPPADLHAFLQADFRHLHAQYGRVVGTRIRTPKLLPLPGR